MAVLVNYPQRRKSQMTKLVRHIGEAIDSALRERAVRGVLTYFEGIGTEAPADFDRNLELTTAVLTSFTPKVFFELHA